MGFFDFNYNHPKTSLSQKITILVNQSINFNILEKNSLMLVISGPSGVGKDTVLRALKKSRLPIYHVITANTRKPRPDEREGVDYFFISRQKFEEMIHHDELLEYSKVYDDYKGVPKSQIKSAIESGKDIILRLDVQGAEKIKALYPEAVLIFLIPSDEKEWLKRLGGRTHSHDRDLETRMNTVNEELQRTKNFDYIVVNAQNKLGDTIHIIESIIVAEHHRSRPRKISV